MIRALLLACVLGASSLAQAQAPQKPPGNPNEAAKALAQRLGAERSVEGLQTILEARNTDLLAAYDRGFRQAVKWGPGITAQPLPPGIEALMVKHHHDPVVGAQLRSLVTGSNHVYRTRELFDLFLAEWRSRKARRADQSIHAAALSTDQAGIEAPLLEWMQAADAPDGEGRRALIYFLARRKSATANAVFVQWLRNGDPDAETISSVLLDMGSKEGVEAVLDQIVEWRRNPPKERPERWSHYASRLGSLPTTTAIPYKRVQAVLPEGDRRHAVTWLTQRKDMDAVPDVLAKLADPTPQGWPLQALIDTDSPEVWNQARAEIERLKASGQLDDGRYRFAVAVLYPKIADPAKHFAEKHATDRARVFAERHAAMGTAKTEARRLRKAEPERYVAAMHAALEAEAKLLAEFEGVHATRFAREQVAADYVEVGHIVRFRMKRPKQALEEYTRAERLGSKMGGLGIADTLQLDLRDKPGAIAQYRKLLAGVKATPAHPGEQGAPDRWMARWLEAQLGYLEHGAVFSGTITPDDVAGGVAMAMAGMASRDEAFDLEPLEGYLRDAFGAGKAQLDRKEVARILRPLPPSAFVLMRTAWYVGLLPDADSVLGYLARQDPAGFGSASIFAVADHVQKDDSGRSVLLSPGLAADPRSPSPLASAKERFFRERRIQVRR